MKKVLEVYDNHIWKELEKPDAVSPEVCYFANSLHDWDFVCYYQHFRSKVLLHLGVPECSWIAIAGLCTG